MEEFFRIFIPIYFVIFFGIAFVAKSILVAKKIGKSPIVLAKDDNAYGIIGFYFKLTMILLFLYTLFLAFVPKMYNYFLPIVQLEILNLKFIGFGVLLFALIWTVIAQKDMKSSWRIGIDTKTETELITSGLFQFSRNPIFLGMILSLVGLFLLTPNALTALFLVLGYILIQIQIRLEEEFLTNQHGQIYLDYSQKVNRYI